MQSRRDNDVRTTGDKFDGLVGQQKTIANAHHSIEGLQRHDQRIVVILVELNWVFMENLVGDLLLVGLKGWLGVLLQRFFHLFVCVKFWELDALCCFDELVEVLQSHLVSHLVPDLKHITLRAAHVRVVRQDLDFVSLFVYVVERVLRWLS